MCASIRRVISAAILAATVPCGLVVSAQGPATSGGGPPWAAAVDAVFAEWDRPGSPGCAVAVSHDGAVAYARGYGVADLEHDAPITPDSVFYAGSVSKQFTAMAAALAIRQGRLGPDEDVRRYVPELPDYGAPITIRHLAHHTSGLRDVNALLVLAGRRDDEAFDNEAVLRIVARQKALNFSPGEAYSYSNSGYALLALAIERATGTPFAAFADERVFRPLGLTASHFHTDVSRIVRHRAYGYDGAAGGAFAINSPQNERAGAGGLFTTVLDLARWNENFYDGRVGGADTIRMLEKPGRLNDGTVLTYAWGLMVAAYRGLPVVEHSGSLGGYRAHVFRLGPERASVSLLCNVSSVDTKAVVRRVADAAFGARFTEPVPPEAKPAPQPPAPRQAAAVQPEDLAAFAGEYYSDELDSSYRVLVDGSRLTLRRGTARGVFALEPQRHDEFTAAGSVVRFTRGADGSVAGLVVDADPIRGLAFSRTRQR